MKQTKAEQHDSVVAGGIATGIGVEDMFGWSSMGPSEPKPALTRRISTGYINTAHPETGTAVVFVPGQSLPVWYLQAEADAAAAAAVAADAAYSARGRQAKAGSNRAA